MNQKLKVKVVKELWYKNGWGLFSCEVKEEDRKLVKLNEYGNFVIKGNMMYLTEGDWYTIEIGELEKSKKGDAYPVIHIDIPKNTSSKAQYDFLRLVLTTPQYEAICKAYPPKSKIKIVDEIKENKIKLSEIKGLRKDKIEDIYEKIDSESEKMKLINKLAPLNVTIGTINRIIDHFDEDVNKAVWQVNQSFYNLCKVKGLGFKKVDVIALNAGEDKEGFKRIEACVNYIVHEQAKDGHCWTSIDEIVKESVELLAIDAHHIESFLLTLDMVEETNLLVVNGDKVTSAYYFKQEKEILKHLQRINFNYKPFVNSQEIIKEIHKAENGLGIKYTDEQISIIKESFEHGIFTINGKSGTGKSTIMKAITNIAKSYGKSYIAVALSGRASQLLYEKGINASTIHRALKYDGKGFFYDEEVPLDYDVIILEETSMINVQLVWSVLKAVKDGAKVIIVGDSGQLPAIGHGDFLRDLLTTRHFAGRELIQIHRQAQDSGVIEIASKVRDGENITSWNWELSECHGVNQDMYVFTYKDKAKLLEQAKKIIINKMSKITEEEIMNFQIIVPTKASGKLTDEEIQQQVLKNIGTVSINMLCQSVYNDLSKPCVYNSTYNFRAKDKVINSGNKYKTYVYDTVEDAHFDNRIIIEYDQDDNPVFETVDLFNGTMGIVQSVFVDYEDKTNSHAIIKFEGVDKYIRFDTTELKDLNLAYAISIHASQGIGISDILTLMDFSAFKLLSKQLLYTAITRASSKCVLLGENNAVLKACNTDNSGLRRTFLADLILGNINKNSDTEFNLDNFEIPLDDEDILVVE